MLSSEVGRLMENLRDLHWEMLLVQDLKLWEDFLMKSQMGMERLKDLH